MAWERSDYSIQSNQSLWIPSPVAPIYSIQDFWEPTEISSQTWVYVVPHDQMVYSICAYYFTANQITWLESKIAINDVDVWHKIGGIGQKWTPGYKSAVRLHAGDELSITCWHLMATLYKYWWEMDFWRDPLV